MHEPSVFFSILTPTWNRARYLQRVFDGLQTQSHRRFEWIVADDGSTDDTEHVVRWLAAQADFPVTYIRADRHVGKIRMDNEAVRQVCGELILWCDSDDWLLPQALQRLSVVWESIPEPQRTGYAGVSALAATEQGCIVNPFPNEVYRDVSWNDLAEVHRVTGDMLFCARADMLKKHPFPEVDFLIPESVVWTAIGHQPARLVSEIVKMVEYQAEHAVSFSGIMAYNRGRAYALAVTVRNLREYRRSWKTRVWRLITYIRYSLHGELALAEARKLWGGNSTLTSYALAFPVAWCLSLKDQWQGKVRQTHREFLANNQGARMSVERLSERRRV